MPHTNPLIKPIALCAVSVCVIAAIVLASAHAQSVSDGTMMLKKNDTVMMNKNDLINGMAIKQDDTLK